MLQDKNDKTDLKALFDAFRLAATGAILLVFSACAAVGIGSPEPPLTPTSVQKLEYYPYQVKGYQNSYPRRTVLILMPTDDREFSGSAVNNHAPMGDKPAIGVVIGPDGDVVQQLYVDSIAPTVQNGIAGALQEAGMTAEVAPYSDYSPAKSRNDDYVVVTIIKRCWVTKRHRRTGADSGAIWNTSADVALNVLVFKPPFKVPFWQGVTQSTYNDPPVGTFGLTSEDEAGIYDEPGEVLSVAITRAIAGIFERNDFRTLVKQDQIHSR